MAAEVKRVEVRIVVSINNSFILTTPISLHCTYRCRCHQVDSRKQTVSNKLHQYN